MLPKCSPLFFVKKNLSRFSKQYPRQLPAVSMVPKMAVHFTLIVVDGLSMLIITIREGRVLGRVFVMGQCKLLEVLKM